MADTAPKSSEGMEKKLLATADFRELYTYFESVWARDARRRERELLGAKNVPE